MASTGQTEIDRKAVSSRTAFSLAGHLLALSIVGVLLKQLRLIGESLGPFELIGLGAALTMIASNRAEPSRADIYFGRFFALMGGAFLCGAGVSAAFFPEHLSMREVIATIYVAILVLGWMSFTEGRLEDRIGLLRNYIAIYCAVLVALAVFGHPFTRFMWFFDIYFGRLMGFSDNPNQLAGLAIAGVALSAARASIVGAISRREMLGTAAIVAAGVLSRSITFLLSMTLSGGVAGTLAAFKATRPGSAGRRVIGVALFLAAVIGLTSLVFVVDNIARGIEDLWSGGSAKGATRFAYWMQALEDAFWSPIVGLGPGGHVRVETTTVLQEAHNIFLELFLSGGLIAFSAYIFLIAVIGITAARQRLAGVMLALIAMVVMGAFQTVLRHAHYWIVLHAILSALLVVRPRPGPSAAPEDRR